MFESCFDIKQKMNKAGAEGIPFLFAVNFELSEGFFIPHPLAQKEVLFNFNGVGNVRKAAGEVPDYHFRKFPESEDEYAVRFSRVKEGLMRGDSFLTNLTIRTPIETSLGMGQIFDYSHALYRLYVPNRFVSFSPEKFVRIIDSKIYSYPMKGTIDAAIPQAKHIILNDYKEKSEHNTIVDLIRNDLNRVATDVRVKRFRYIDTLHTNGGGILQVSSEIEGKLAENFAWELGTLLFDLLPAGSISGAPKEATLQIIREAEMQSRGYYSGVAGYFDGKNMDSCVLIRYIECDENNKLYFRSGGGITVNSDCESEYKEAIQKVYLPF